MTPDRRAPHSTACPRRCPTRSRGRRRGSQGGQIVVIFSLCVVLLVGLAALAIDGSQNRSSKETDQSFADAAARSASQLWGAEIAAHSYTGMPPGASTDPAFLEVQQLLALDGVATSATSQCTTSTHVVYYDVRPTACPSAPSRWTNSVEIDVPATVTTGCTPAPYNCIGVIVGQVRRNVFAGVIGFGTTTVRSMAIGLSSTAAAGSTESWGFNIRGMLGLGDTANRIVPATGPTGFVRFSHGGDHLEAIKTDGTLWGWGDNQFGQQGDGGTTNHLIPTYQAWAGTPVAVGVGQHHMLVAPTATTLLAVGNDNNGQLGDNSTTEVHTSVPVSTTNHVWANIKQLTGGDDSSYALETAGTVWAWGGNGSGQVGDNSTTDKGAPVAVQVFNGGNLKKITAIAAGSHHALALDSKGTVWSWGRNTRGALGDGTTIDRAYAVQVPGLTNVVSIAGGNSWSIAVKGDGTVWAWGDNGHGQLGITPDNADHPIPVQIAGLSKITLVDGGAGDDQMEGLAVTSGGTVYTWGDNKYGELGQNTCCADSPTPTVVAGVTGVTTIANGSGWLWTIGAASVGGAGLLWG